MRWLVGWSSAAVSIGPRSTVLPVGASLLWNDPDPLWAVGDWRADEVRVVDAAPGGTAPAHTGARNGSGSAPSRLAILGRCGATDAELRLGLVAARGGALRHL